MNGLRALLEGMLHGDPYQRPHSFEVLDSPFFQPLRRPGDTLLGDLDDEAEQGGRVMLLQVRRGVQQHPPPASPAAAASSVPPGSSSSSSSSSGNGQQPQPQASSSGGPAPPPLPPQLLAVRSEERPLEVYCSYMDLAEIDDDRSTVVVCGRKEGMRVGAHAGVDEITCMMKRQTDRLINQPVAVAVALALIDRSPTAARQEGRGLHAGRHPRAGAGGVGDGAGGDFRRGGGGGGGQGAWGEGGGGGDGGG